MAPSGGICLLNLVTILVSKMIKVNSPHCRCWYRCHSWGTQEPSLCSLHELLAGTRRSRPTGKRKRIRNIFIIDNPLSHNFLIQFNTSYLMPASKNWLDWESQAQQVPSHCLLHLCLCVLLMAFAHFHVLFLSRPQLRKQLNPYSLCLLMVVLCPLC